MNYEPTICKKCDYIQWSIFDRVYASLFGCCHCDEVRWEKKELSMEEFEKRRKKAVDESFKSDK